jgi:integrase
MKDVRDAQPTNTDRVIWDKSGFGVRIRPSGAKSWLVQYRCKADGQTRRMTLGKVDKVQLAQARAKADKILARAELGEDPAAEKGEARRGQTVEDLSKAWMEAKREERKATTCREYQRQLDHIINPRFGKRKASSLTGDDVRELFFEIRDKRRKPVMANRVVATLSSMLGWAKRRPEYNLRENPAADAIDRADRGKERADRRALTDEEVHRFLVACREIRAEEGQSARLVTAFELMLRTGMRPSEVYRLKWSEIDFERKLIHLEAQKTDGAVDDSEPVHLRADAAALLKALDREDGDLHVFPSPTVADEPIKEARKTWAEICERAKFDKPARPKTLRKTHGTIARNLGHDLGAVAKALRHANQSTTEKHYAELGDPIVAAMEEVVQKRIAALANPKAKVVRLK